MAELVHLYKSQILSYIEYRTAAIYHSADTHLNRIDDIQRRFLREVGLTEAAALTEYHLAPLPARRYGYARVAAQSGAGQRTASAVGILSAGSEGGSRIHAG